MHHCLVPPGSYFYSSTNKTERVSTTQQRSCQGLLRTVSLHLLCGPKYVVPSYLRTWSRLNDKLHAPTISCQKPRTLRPLSYLLTVARLRLIQILPYGTQLNLTASDSLLLNALFERIIINALWTKYTDYQASPTNRLWPYVRGVLLQIFKVILQEQKTLQTHFCKATWIFHWRVAENNRAVTAIDNG